MGLMPVVAVVRQFVGPVGPLPKTAKARLNCGAAGGTARPGRDPCFAHYVSSRDNQTKATRHRHHHRGTCTGVQQRKGRDDKSVVGVVWRFAFVLLLLSVGLENGNGGDEW